MLRELRNNNRGIIFGTVLIIIIVAMVLAISVLSLNISQVKSSEDELKHIQARALSDGVFEQLLASKVSGNPGNTISYSEPLGNITFAVNVDIDGTGSGPVDSASVPMTIDVTF